jgi:hypothetical protein
MTMILATYDQGGGFACNSMWVAEQHESGYPHIAILATLYKVPQFEHSV